MHFKSCIKSMKLWATMIRSKSTSFSILLWSSLLHLYLLDSKSDLPHT